MGKSGYYVSISETGTLPYRLVTPAGPLLNSHVYLRGIGGAREPRRGQTAVIGGGATRHLTCEQVVLMNILINPCGFNSGPHIPPPASWRRRCHSLPRTAARGRTGRQVDTVGDVPV